MRSNPFEEFDRLFDRMNRHFGVDPWTQERSVGGVHTGGIAVDVAEVDDAVVVTADVPGYDREELDVSVVDDVLTIVAEREADEEDASEDYVRRERRASSMRRSITLPAAVDADAASASYTNGVLTVSLPRLEPGQQGQHIDIE